jgi:hypothetical protein
LVGFKEVFLRYQGLVAGARATVMVAGTAAAVGVALANGRRLNPVFVEASPAPKPQAAIMSAPAIPVTFPDPARIARRFFARRVALATVLAVAGIVIVAAVAAAVSFSIPQSSSAAAAPALGPAAELRAASGIAGGFEQAYATSMPSADAVGGTLLAAAEERQAWEVLRAMKIIDEERQAAASVRALAATRNPASTYNTPSGYAAGTVVRSRITIYGCVGPGGGFCNNMASGLAVFEGAAACSADLPFGTRLKIVGDPTGRVYECLDRGALAATWVDVFFYNTSDGIAWQSLLGGTVTDIEIVN